MDLAKPGELAFGEVVWNALQPMINCRCLGMQQIKGKGIMEVCHIVVEGEISLLFHSNMPYSGICVGHRIARTKSHSGASYSVTLATYAPRSLFYGRQLFYG